MPTRDDFRKVLWHGVAVFIGAMYGSSCNLLWSFGLTAGFVTILAVAVHFAQEYKNKKQKEDARKKEESAEVVKLKETIDNLLRALDNIKKSTLDLYAEEIEKLKLEKFRYEARLREMRESGRDIGCGGMEMAIRILDEKIKDSESKLERLKKEDGGS